MGGSVARLLAALAEVARRRVALPILIVDVDGLPRVLDGAPADADLRARVVVPLSEGPAIPRVGEIVFPVNARGMKRVRGGDSGPGGDTA